MKQKMAIIIGFLTLLVPATSHAQVVGGLAAGVLKMTIGDFMNELNQDLNNAIINGANQANGAVVNAAGQANIVLANLQVEYQNDLDKAVSTLNAQQQQVFAKVQDMIGEANGLLGKAYDLETTTTLDVSNIESTLPFTHVPEFYLERIDGVALFKGNYDYPIKIYAHGIQNAAKVTVTFSATLSGKPITFAHDPSITGNGQAEFLIPQSQINSLFDPTRLVSPELVIKVTIAKSGFFGAQSRKSYSIPIWLNLYPNQAATGTLNSVEPTFGWVSYGTVAGAVVSSPAAPNGCKYSGCNEQNIAYLNVNGSLAGPPQVGDKRIVSVSLQCVSNVAPCGATPQQYIVSTIDPSGTRASISFITDSISLLFRVNGVVQEWQQLGSKSANIPVSFSFDALTKAPVDNAAQLVTLHVVPFFNQAGYDLPVPGSDPHKLISFVSRTANAYGPGVDAIELQTNSPQ
jgi:hypothetical protein